MADVFLTEENLNRMPFSLEAEQSVLGAIILDPDKIRDFANAIRVWRFAIALLASIWGLTGMAIGTGLLILHLLSLKSLGTSYIKPFDNELVRKRLVKDKRRNPRTNPLDKRNQK